MQYSSLTSRGSASQLIGLLVSQSVSHLIGLLVSRSVSQLIGQLVSQSVSQSISQSIGQSVNRSVSQSIGQSANQLHLYPPSPTHYILNGHDILFQSASGLSQAANQEISKAF